jgi:hypothetical protein
MKLREHIKLGLTLCKRDNNREEQQQYSAVGRFMKEKKAIRRRCQNFRFLATL